MNTARLNQGTPLLLNAVSKHYAENIVLNQLDLHIPAGQFVAVVGRSGGGKSTLLRLLAGLETPTAGDVLAGTTPLAEIQEDTRMMFQDARLLPWKSVIDNVGGNDSNLLIVFYVQIMPDDFVMQLHRF